MKNRIRDKYHYINEALKLTVVIILSVFVAAIFRDNVGNVPGYGLGILTGAAALFAVFIAVDTAMAIWAMRGQWIGSIEALKLIKSKMPDDREVSGFEIMLIIEEGGRRIGYGTLYNALDALVKEKVLLRATRRGGRVGYRKEVK